MDHLEEIRARIDELERDEQDRMRLLDLWTFQSREIGDARLQPGEDERLEIEKRVLANAEKIYTAAMTAFDLLYEGSDSTSTTLRAAQKQLEELVRYEPRFQEALSALESARIGVEDVGATLRDYAGGIQSSPERLAEHLRDAVAAVGLRIDAMVDGLIAAVEAHGMVAAREDDALHAVAPGRFVHVVGAADVHVADRFPVAFDGEPAQVHDRLHASRRRQHVFEACHVRLHESLRGVQAGDVLLVG